MRMRQTGFDSFTAQASGVDHASLTRRLDIFVGKGFCALELAAVMHTLSTANAILGREMFGWRLISDTPGLVTGSDAMMVRAEPAIEGDKHGDLMMVIGGRKTDMSVWMRRARAMQRCSCPVVLLSDAATAYVKATTRPAGRVTTHWADIETLRETGDHPNLTTRFSENSDGIITAAGAGATAELIIGIIAPLLESVQVAELGNRLLLHVIRKADAEQPRNIADNKGLFTAHITHAIQLMEDTIAEPISIAELTGKVGVSTRHLERVFRKVFDDTPARFYKRLRTKRARVMIEETLLPMIEVAVATGFGSSDSLAKAVKDAYGLSPSKMRQRRTITLRADGN